MNREDFINGLADLNKPDQGMRYHGGGFDHDAPAFDERTGEPLPPVHRAAELTVYGDRARFLYRLIEKADELAAALTAPQPLQGGEVTKWAGYCRTCHVARGAAPCRKCGADLEALRPDHEEPDLPDIEHIRELAREVGYAIGVHGTQERDLDIIAAPWVEPAASAPDLAAHLAAGLNARILNDKVQDKPLGRWSCSIQIDGWFKVIDLSVCPALISPAHREGEG